MRKHASCLSRAVSVSLTAGALLAVPAAHAAYPVIDIGAIAQLVMQGQKLAQQIDTARSHLDQARAEFNAMTGGRGMEQLLSGTVRNYLPMDWVQLSQVVQGTGGAYGLLAAELNRALEANAVLTSAQLAALSIDQRADVERSRRSVATLQALTRQALAATSDRFGSMQTLVDAISRASDQKAVLDLQARIGAEATMLANEQAKLEALYQAARAEADAQTQRLRERAIADIGSYRQLPPLGL